MKQTERNTTLLIAGLLGWLSVMLITRVRATFELAEWVYYAGFGLFLLGFVLINTLTYVLDNKRLATGCMAVQVSGFFLVFITCQTTDGLILLVIFAGQLPFFATQRQAMATLLAINGVCFLLYHLLWQKGLSPSLIAIALNLAFQCFALAVAHIAVKESKARLALEQANAELMSTRSLLEQTSRQSERLQLSRDLHDICGHQLTALLLNLEFLSQTVPPDKQQQVQETKAIARDLLQQIRSVVKENKQTASLNLNAAIDSLFEHLPQVKANFESRLAKPLHSNHHAEVLLRICQEAVSNALRYGSEKTITIALQQQDQQLTMRITNPYSGATQVSPGGSGLANMQERAAQLHGHVTISTRDKIWTVTVTLPYQEKHYD